MHHGNSHAQASRVATPVTVPPDDPNWFWSPYNFNVQPAAGGGLTAASNNPGAYFKLAFSGTSFTLLLNNTNTPSTAYMTLRWSVDGAAWVDAQLPNAAGDKLPLASGLAAGTHTLWFFILNSNQWLDRWHANVDVLRVAGAQLDAGASLSAYPFISQSRMLVYWDSIGEGINVNGNGHGDLIDNDSTRNWVQVLAQSLQTEVGSVSYGAQGWVCDGSFHAVMNTSQPAEQHAWSRYDSSFSRLDANGLLQPPPQYVVMGHGTNDYGGRKDESLVQASALAWLQAITVAAGPQAHIFLTVPFGGFEAKPLAAAFAAFQASALGGRGDPRVHFVDLAEYNAQEGLTWSGANKNSADGVHPLAWRSAQLGGILANAIQKQL